MNGCIENSCINKGRKASCISKREVESSRRTASAYTIITPKYISKNKIEDPVTTTTAATNFENRPTVPKVKHIEVSFTEKTIIFHKDGTQKLLDEVHISREPVQSSTDANLINNSFDFTSLYFLIPLISSLLLIIIILIILFILKKKKIFPFKPKRQLNTYIRPNIDIEMRPLSDIYSYTNNASSINEKKINAKVISSPVPPIPERTGVFEIITEKVNYECNKLIGYNKRLLPVYCSDKVSIKSDYLYYGQIKIGKLSLFVNMFMDVDFSITKNNDIYIIKISGNPILEYKLNETERIEFLGSNDEYKIEAIKEVRESDDGKQKIRYSYVIKYLDNSLTIFTLNAKSKLNLMNPHFQVKENNLIYNGNIIIKDIQ